MEKLIIEIIGWVSAAMMLSAYLLLNSHKVSAKSLLYQWLNVISGAGLIINSGWNGAYPSVAINVIWMFIGIHGVLRVADTGGRPR
ncbi:MAG: hypothetical protein ACHQIL_07330 [Steroidobacterales bacterium]